MIFKKHVFTNQALLLTEITTELLIGFKLSSYERVLSKKELRSNQAFGNIQPQTLINK